MNNRPLRVIISGGGTAGHIHPAVSVADALRSLLGEDGVEILFVGAEGKMEMERVPNAGYRIVGLPVAGLQRRPLVSKNNLALPFKVVRSLRRARRIVRDFKPDIVAGFGGYASAPVLWAAQRMGVPTMIQEQNSYAGLTNRLLSKRARAICVAYEKMERFFPAAKLVYTGNPLRGHFSGLAELSAALKAEACAHFGFDPASGRKTLLVVGGSLGTRTLNRCMLRWLDTLAEREDVQVIWQNGKYYDAQIAAAVEARAGGLPENVWRGAFVERMDLAYALADVVVARAGACTVSELELVGRPVIFVPSPNVAEDHQTRNAQALVAAGAARLVPDASAEEEVIPDALELLADDARRAEMVRNILKLGRPDAALKVAEIVLKIANEYGERKER
ncbi:undecaprenyldiphospho-muramoylpentapeptide beta-N-acetylglucosaminyltransferase [uncultured Rikenella sp.]|uniref:undecaprenyldiphospho-muramoylpentapeptide beta-N-acetylglucosaminyltransferase n=1 Tax=uncultured Rikenella sp. TaxID=368003 RepID=UPI00262E0924|nr:undecaprenyldiphospho-muramoylpentapeptide beta-N-acetylglucosaminyltransferase [uncultured Rikenella sp.]